MYACFVSSPPQIFAADANRRRAVDLIDDAVARARGSVRVMVHEPRIEVRERRAVEEPDSAGRVTIGRRLLAGRTQLGPARKRAAATSSKKGHRESGTGPKVRRFSSSAEAWTFEPVGPDPNLRTYRVLMPNIPDTCCDARRVRHLNRDRLRLTPGGFASSVDLSMTSTIFVPFIQA